jgi:hypothetical protein
MFRACHGSAILLLVAYGSSQLHKMYQSRCTAKNSWWWAERLPETCGIIIPIKLEFSASVGFIHKESVTMHGHTIVKNWNLAESQYSRYRNTAFRNTLCFLIGLRIRILFKYFLYFRNKCIYLSSSVNIILTFMSILYQFLAVDDLPKLVFSFHSLISVVQLIIISIISFSCNPDILKQFANVKLFISDSLFALRI